MKQKDIIVRYLQEANGWQPAYKLRGIPTKFGFIGHQGDRRCRELVQEGKLQHKIEGGYAWYKANAVQYVSYRVIGFDGKVEKLLNFQTT